MKSHKKRSLKTLWKNLQFSLGRFKKLFFLHILSRVIKMSAALIRNADKEITEKRKFAILAEKKSG
jgi:hypothetical protein